MLIILLRVAEFLQAAKRLRPELRRRMDVRRMSALKLLLNELEDGHLPFVCLQYNDSEGVQHSVPAVYLGKLDSFDGSKVKNMVSLCSSSVCGSHENSLIS